MSASRIIVGLDLGSHRVRVVVAEVHEDGRLKVLGLGTVPSEGIRKGIVVGFEPALDSVRRSVAEAERSSGLELRSVFASVTGDHFRALRSEGVHAKEGESREITPEDMEQVVRVARSVQLPPGFRIQHTLPIDFVLDGRGGIKDPVGMDGVRLQAEVLLILGEISVLENAAKVIQKAGLNVEGLVFSPLATALAALQEAEREEGVVLMDIGAGTTEILVLWEGAVRHTEVLPLGGANVTRDLSIGLNVSLEDAERLKLDHATLLAARDPAQRFAIRQVGQDEDRYVTAETLRSIVEPRIRELLDLAWERARKCEHARRPGTGVVLCGGGATLRGLAETAAQLYERSVRLGAPLQQEGLTAELQDPRYTPTVGLLHYGYRRLGSAAWSDARAKSGSRGLARWLHARGKRQGK